MGSENGKKKQKTMKCAKSSVLEDALYAWFSHMRSLAAQCLKQEFADFKMEEDSDPESVYNTIVAPDPSHSEVYSALEIALQWLEDQEESDVVQLLFLKSLRNLAAQKTASSLKSK
ncbi:UNVERIFIED_CONTAM: hypothetical protein K2H54_039240 [Gekko kuhli]